MKQFFEPEIEIIEILDVVTDSGNNETMSGDVIM